jgi:Na+-transporting methylmalonyl-CoA/oxaloacetate decarboxylase beta subunit
MISYLFEIYLEAVVLVMEKVGALVFDLITQVHFSPLPKLPVAVEIVLVKVPVSGT